MADPTKPANNARGLYTIPRMHTMRLLNGWSRAKLAQEAKVDRDTITRIEKNQGVQDYIAAKVHAAVSKNLPDDYKKADTEIVSTDFFEANKKIKASG